MRFVGASLAFGLLASTLLRLRGWQGVILTTITTFTAIYVTYRAFYFPQASTILPLAPIGLASGIFCGWRASQLTGFEVKSFLTDVPLFSLIAGIVTGLLWTVAMWALHFLYLPGLIGNPAFTWDTVLLIMTANIITGLIGAYYLNRAGRIGLLAGSLLSFVALYVVVSWQFFDYSFTVPMMSPSFEVVYSEGTALIPATAQPIIFYNSDQLEQIFTLTLPFVIVIALGMNLPVLLSGWWNWIGESRTPKERGAWMTATLGYVMVMTALVSVLTLYSPQINRLWELSWSVWAFATFVMAMATLRWAKWGANGLIISGLILLVGGIAVDGVAMYQQALEGMQPGLLQPLTEGSITLRNSGIPSAITELHLWGVWSLFLAIFVWGAQRKALWGGIGLVTLVVAWLMAVFAIPLQGSVAIFATTNVALVYYVLQSKYDLMEVSRLNLPWRGDVQPATGGIPDTVVNLTDIPLPGAPATQIISNKEGKVYATPLPDALQTQAPSIDDLRHLDTVDFDHVPSPIHPNDMDTVAPPPVNPADLYTQFPRETEFINLDEEIEAGESRTNLTDIKINLDTSKLNTQPEPENAKSGLTDIKINLDTSALNTELETKEAKTEVAPEIKFKFDSSKLTDRNTIKFDEEDDTGDDRDGDDTKK